MKRIDTIYRVTKKILDKPEVKKGIGIGLIFVLIFGSILGFIVPFEKGQKVIPETKALVANQGDGLLFYAAAASTTPQWRTYDNASNDFSLNSDTVTGAQPVITQVRTSPTKQEAIAAYQDTSGNLRVLCYDGTSWTQDWTIAVAASGTPTTQRFSIAYETNTGDAIVAYSRNTAATNALAYRTKPGSTGCGSANWTAAVNFPTTTSVTTGTVQWVKSARDGRSSSVLDAFIWADSNSDLGAAIWSGTAFGNFKLLDASLEFVSTSQDVDNFDVSYESLSGDVMTVWGNSAGANGTNGARYMTCTGGTSSCTWGSATAIPTISDDATNLDLSADPLTDRMAFAAIGNSGSDLSAGYWSGTAWTGYANVDTSTEKPRAGMKLVTTGWLNNGANKKWYLSYDDSSGVGLSYKYATAGGSITSPADYTATPALNDIRGRYDTDINPFNDAELIQTVSDSTNGIFAYKLSMDASGNLAWSNMASAASLGTKPNHPQQGFSFQYWRFVPTPIITVGTIGTQTVNLMIPSTSQYVGGAFTMIRDTGSASITGITINENGTVDAQANIANIRLFYDLDTTAPYDCTGESYTGTETQYGSTVASFDAADGNAAFNGSVSVSSTQAVCLYTVLDVGSGATNNQTLELQITNPSTDIVASAGTVSPSTAIAISGTTTLQVPSNNNPNLPASLTQPVSESAWTTDNTPDLGFTISDPDGGDTVKYEIQVADNPSFTSPIIDYTHGTLSANPTTFTFTVGSYGGGSCVGTCPATLSDSSTGYWWKVKAIDNSGASSAYVEFGVAGTMDLKVDATAPSGGTVYDNKNTDTQPLTSDSDGNGDGDLTKLSSTWSGITDSTSGIQKYEYSIGTTAGATDILTWTDNATTAYIRKGSLILQTGKLYFFNVRTTDNAGNISNVISSNGQVVDPTLSFSIDSNVITFADLNNANSWTDTKTTTFTTSTNASSGYTIKGYINQLLTSLAYPSITIPNFSCLWSAPCSWSGYGFGYTSNDTLVQGSNRFNNGTYYAAYAGSSPGDVVADHTAAVNGSTGAVSNEQFTLTHKVSVQSSQTASKYQTTATFVVTANY